MTSNRRHFRNENGRQVKVLSEICLNYLNCPIIKLFEFLTKSFFLKEKFFTKNVTDSKLLITSKISI